MIYTNGSIRAEIKRVPFEKWSASKRQYIWLNKLALVCINTGDYILSGFDNKPDLLDVMHSCNYRLERTV